MIFGDQYPVIEGISSGIKTLLINSNLEPDWIQPNEIEHQSVINGYRSYTRVSLPHAEFKVIVNLFKYANPGQAFWNIYQYLGQDVYFYPHGNNETIKIKAHLVDITPFYLEQPWHYDACELILRSVEPVSYTQESFDRILITGDGKQVKTKDGKNISIKKGTAVDSQKPDDGGGAYDI